MRSLAVHALTIGTIGGLAIGMMVRTARGSTVHPAEAARMRGERLRNIPCGSWPPQQEVRPGATTDSPHDRHREYIMKAQTLTTVLPVGFAVLVTLAACGSKEAPPSTPAATSTEAAAPAAAPVAPATTAAQAGGADGAQIYRISCSTCHGAEGKGDGVAAAALNPKPVNFATGAFKYDTNKNGTPGEIEDIMTIIRDGTAKHGGSPLMAPWPTLSEAQREAVAEYVKAFHTG